MPDSAVVDPMERRPDISLILTDQPIAFYKMVKVQCEAGEIEVPCIKGVGSSAMEDTDGDEFSYHALEQLVQLSLENELNVLLNHTTEQPDCMFGGIYGMRITERTTKDGKSFAAVEQEVDLQVDNAPAMKTFGYIVGKNCKPRRLGFSCGVVYTEVKPKRTKTGRVTGVRVEDLFPAEHSVVTMPSNRLAWIETIAKDFRQKGIIPNKRKNLNGTDELSYILMHRDHLPDTVQARLNVLNEYIRIHGCPGCLLDEGEDCA
jgi:hypothetical protein